VFLCSLVSAGEHSLGLHKDWVEYVANKRPTIGQYLLKGMRYSIVTPDDFFAISAPLPPMLFAEMPKPAQRVLSMCTTFDRMLLAIVRPLGIICAAGGTKAFFNMLKSWVNEKEGRKIIIKKGDTEIEIHGGVSDMQLNKGIEIFEKRLSELIDQIP